MPFLRGRRDSDGREKAEAYGAEEATMMWLMENVMCSLSATFFLYIY